MTRHYRTMCLEADQTCQRGISKPSQTATVNEPKLKPSHPTSQPHTPTQSLHSMGAIPPNPFTPWVPSYPIPSLLGCRPQFLHSMGAITPNPFTACHVPCTFCHVRSVLPACPVAVLSVRPTARPPRGSADFSAAQVAVLALAGRAG